jgi:outer membrane receptor protein involved in Fe transport
VRELAPYEYYDFLRDRIVVGNPSLRTATIHNADLRWEWFFGEGQVAAISGFYKKFYDPIELGIVRPETGDSQYQNAKGATNFGTELELRSDLGVFFRKLQGFSASGNLSLINSRIELVDTGATRNVRRLAGQAPYVANLSLRWTVPKTKVSLGFVYNVVGPRIADVGVRVSSEAILPDVVEEPFHSLDFVSAFGVAKNLVLKLRARNLLRQHRVLKQGSLTVLDLDPGVTVSLSLGYDF